MLLYIASCAHEAINTVAAANRLRQPTLSSKSLAFEGKAFG